MGWTGTLLTHNRRVGAEEAIRAERGEEFLSRVVDYAHKGAVVYAAVRSSSDPNEIYGLVLLMRSGRSTSRPGERELSTKAIDETEGPAEDDCPARILDRLTPTDNAYAVEWRQRCRARISARAALPKLRAGQRIRFATALSFQGGARRDTFEFIAGNRFRGLDEAGNVDRVVYRIPRWRERAFEIVRAAVRAPQ